MRLLLTTLLLILLTIACQETKPEPPTLNGVWTSIGSGWILEIKDSTTYSFYDITNISCLPRRVGDLDELQNSLTLQPDTISLVKGVITYRFTRLEQLPDLCANERSSEQQADVLFNFEVFAETVQEHYAFMELNQVNWDSLYDQARQRLAGNPTEVELYQTIDETLEQLNDNHAYLEADDQLYEALEALENTEEEEDENEENPLPEYGDFQIAAMVSQHHLEEEMTKDSWLIQWGRLVDGVGYMQVKAMWLYADLDIPEALIQEVGYVDAYVETFYRLYEGDYIEQEVAGVAQIMDRIMADLADTDAMVIDLRFNGGGQDAVSFEILSRFLDQRLQVATQKLKHGDGYSPVLSLYVDGTAEAYTKPVYVLTSPQTGSAAEAFAIATMAMDRVQRIGSPTTGAMSTALEKELPNGWVFSISNEIYMDNDGNSYENKGIPVDYELGYPKDRQPFFRSVADDLTGDKQQILKAIEALQ